MKLNRTATVCVATLCLAMAIAATQLPTRTLAQAVTATVTGFLDASGNTVTDSVTNPHPVTPGGTPFAVTAFNTTGSQLNFSIPVAAGKYFYLTSFQVEGNGASVPSNVVVTYYNLAGGTGSNPTVSFGSISVPGNPTAQVEYNKIFPYPWQSVAPNTVVGITVGSFGTGNTQITGRVVGYYQ